MIVDLTLRLSTPDRATIQRLAAAVYLRNCGDPEYVPTLDEQLVELLFLAGRDHTYWGIELVNHAATVIREAP